MFTVYLPVLILQAYCLYHAYKNDHASTWFVVIVFLPLVGSLLYLFTQVFNRPNVEQITENVKQAVNQNYKIEKLQKESHFTDTIANRLKLADEYLSKRKFEQAIELYESCLEGYNRKDPYIKMKLIGAYYKSGDYNSVLRHGMYLKNDPSFKNSEARVAYAWSLFHKGDTDMAERHFKAMDIRFSNYTHRIEYSRYLREVGRPDLAKAKLEELKEEIEHMDGYEQRLKRDTYREIKHMLEQA